MITLVAILSWLTMPLDSLASADADAWYLPSEFIYLDHEPSIEEIERDLKHRHIRIMEIQPQDGIE